MIRRVLTILRRENRTRSLLELPKSLTDHTNQTFGLVSGSDRVPEVFRDEERRFNRMLTRGRKVLAKYEPGRDLSEQELTYLHETHGLPPDLVRELLEAKP